jgi:RNA polymerase sigma-70 factor (ECF subfamily)
MPASETSHPSVGRYRAYLRFLAQLQLDRAIQAKIDPSDVVQEALLRAHQSLGQYKGSTEEQFAAWLRSILAHCIADAVRKMLRRREDLDQSLEESLHQSSARLEQLLAVDSPSPGARVDRNEQLLRLVDALEVLPEDQRTAIERKYFGGASLPQIAAEMGRSRASVMGLLYRALKTLRQTLGQTEAGIEPQSTQRSQSKDMGP